MLAFPGSIAMDDQEVLFVADRKLNVIQLFDREGNFQAVFGDENGPMIFADLSSMVMDPKSGILAIYNAVEQRLEIFKDLKTQYDLKGLAHQANFQYLRAKRLANGIGNREQQVCQQCHDGHLVGPTPRAFNHPIFAEGQNQEKTAGNAPEDASAEIALNGCLSCHIMHGSLSADGTDLKLKNQCQDCHASATDKKNHHPSQLELASSDTTQGNKDTPTNRAGVTHDAPECLTCHSVHNGVDEASLNFQKDNPNTFCLSCHFSETSQFQHPLMQTLTMETSPQAGKPGLSSKTHAVTCLSCHSIHRFGDDSSTKTESAAKLQKECVFCHEEQSRISEPHRLADHEIDPSWPQSLGSLKGHSCLGCHAMHPNQKATALLKSANDLKVFDPASRLCLSCHEEKATPSQREANRIHPRNLLTNKLPNGSQLLTYDSEGKKITDLDQGGNLGCLSCHVSHGPDKMLKPTDAVIPLCLSCHQQNGLPLYKQFHKMSEGKNP
jgi:predicted CXXCH cytochrome family protein